MHLYHNGVKLDESEFMTSMEVGISDTLISDQGSRTVVSIMLVFNC